MKGLKATREEEGLHKAFQEKLNVSTVSMANVGSATGALDHLTTENLRTHMLVHKTSWLDKKEAKKSKNWAKVKDNQNGGGGSSPSPGVQVATSVKVRNPLSMVDEFEDGDEDFNAGTE